MPPRRKKARTNYAEDRDDDGDYEVPDAPPEEGPEDGDTAELEERHEAPAAEDDDVEMVRAPAQMAHKRPDCTVCAFEGPGANKMMACPKCFCVVCDVPVGDCLRWDEHCRATTAAGAPDAKYWEEKRKALKDIDLRYASRVWFDRLGIGLDRWARLDSPGARTSWVARFLNRLLGMPLAQQNILFELFARYVAAEIEERRESGELDEGIRTLQGERVEVARSERVAEGVAHLEIDVDRGCSFEAAVAQLDAAEAHKAETARREAAQKRAWGVVDDLTSTIARETFENSFFLAKSKNRKTRERQGLLAVRVASFSPGDTERIRVLRPATGARQMTYKELKRNYAPLPKDEAAKHWRAEWSEGDNQCLHAPDSDACQGALCDFGKRTQKVHCLACDSLLHTMCKAMKAKKSLKVGGRFDVCRLIESAAEGGAAKASRVVVKLPRKGWDEIIDELGAEGDYDEDDDYMLEDG
mmetsp:Transcript_4073/g.11994  ORF Transcript_4073/g.11994 Transcript_4073/m.11994 type:complete len:470 (+) Transcript_4073:213-1622(+)